MNEAQKDIVGGMDTGGGVGFGIPSDWSGGGVQDGEPDPVIAEHNERAKTSLDLLLPPRAQVSYQILAEQYMKLPENSNVRKRAEEFEGTYSKSFNRHNKAKSDIDKQKTVAVMLVPMTGKIAGEAQSKLNQWTKDASEGKINEVMPSYTDSVRMWQNDVVSIIKSHDIRLWDISKSLSKGFDVLASIDIATDNPFAGEHKFDSVVKYFDDAIAELEAVSSNGGGEILDEYRKATIDHEDDLKELERVESELNQALSGANAQNTRKSASSKYYRFLDDKDDALASAGDDIGIPNRVPDYRLALETSPRVCGSCRFFEWDGKSERGQCYAFDFEAKANYTCNAWQATSLTSTHTTVRNEGDKMHTRKDADTGWQEPIYVSDVRDKDGTPKEIMGQVSGEHVGSAYEDDIPMDYQEDSNYSIPKEPDENAALRASKREFLPNDIVYSKFCNSYAMVVGTVQMGGLKLYSLKLINGSGITTGSAFSYGDDLQPRSKSAMKSKRRIRQRVKSDDPQDVVIAARNVYRALEAVMSDHADLKSAPLSNQDVLTPLEDDIIATLEDPMFQNVTTGSKRKYYRALQDSLYSIGAARQLLFRASKTITMMSYKDMGTPSEKYGIMMDAQKNAYDRVATALKMVKDALTLPSATHNMPAPGLKGMSIKDISDKVFDLVSAKVGHDNIEVVSEGMPLGEYEYTVHKFVKQGGMEKALDALSKLFDQIRKVSDDKNLSVEIIGSETSELEGKAGFTASVTFEVIVVI